MGIVSLMAQARLVVLASPLLLAGCGLQTPDMASPIHTGSQVTTSSMVFAVVQHVRNELVCVAVALDDLSKARGGPQWKPLNGLAWLNDNSSKSAVAIVTLTMTVDEKTTLSPSLLETTPYSNKVYTFASGGNVPFARMFTFGLGGGLSADATRKISIDYTFSLKDDLLGDKEMIGKCDPSTGQIKPGASPLPDGVLLEGDLKLGDSFTALLSPFGLATGTQPPLFAKPQKSAPTTLETDVTFIIDANGSASPAWKLVPISYLSSATPLLMAERKATNEVLITIGPNAADTKTAHNIGKANSGIALAAGGGS